MLSFTRADYGIGRKQAPEDISMKNDERISPRSGSSRFSTFKQSSKFQLFLALTIIAAIFLASCVKEKRNEQGSYGNSNIYVADAKQSVGTVSANTTAMPMA